MKFAVIFKYANGTERGLFVDGYTINRCSGTISFDIDGVVDEYTLSAGESVEVRIGEFRSIVKRNVGGTCNA